MCQRRNKRIKPDGGIVKGYKILLYKTRNIHFGWYSPFRDFEYEIGKTYRTNPSPGMLECGDYYPCFINEGFMHMFANYDDAKEYLDRFDSVFSDDDDFLNIAVVECESNNGDDNILYSGFFESNLVGKKEYATLAVDNVKIVKILDSKNKWGIEHVPVS